MQGILVLILSIFVSTGLSASPDRVYINGVIWTGEGELAQAFATTGSYIEAVGDTSEIQRLAGSGTVTVDLQGRFVTPGFIDNHTHFLDASLALTAVNLRDAASPEEFAVRIAARARARPGEWILQGNWDHELWGGQLPTRDWIDADTANTPVLVTRLDGHMGLANSAALALAGITADTPDPVGGAILRDEDGRPTGLLKDTAMEAVLKVIPPVSEERIDEALRLGFERALQNGVTQVHDMGSGVTEVDGAGYYKWQTLEAFRRLYRAGDLPIRAYLFVPLADWQGLVRYTEVHGKGDDWVRWGGVKGFVDGSLGSTTAWFYDPYTDAPETTGLMMTDLDVLYGQITGAREAGLHVAVHAIGDRANDWLLDTYEALLQKDPDGDPRFRVEHAQHLSAEAVDRFAALKVIPSMQPYHAIDDGRWAEKRIGAERLKGTYAFRSLLDAGAPLTFGSDWIVAPINPLTGIDAAVNRRTIDGRHPEGWQPQERITVEEALTAYTSANAYAGYQERLVGRIAPGLLADFVVLSDNLLEIDPDDILEVRPLLTVIGGEVRYDGGF